MDILNVNSMNIYSTNTAKAPTAAPGSEKKYQIKEISEHHRRLSNE
ncbi:MAG: hypothetical protein K6F53_07200 [Lachnospiraceae bacterium]|nr:hypothetical protein [Lachnospiraceae bacterium]